jgi:hypothetical protein
MTSQDINVLVRERALFQRTNETIRLINESKRLDYSQKENMIKIITDTIDDKNLDIPGKQKKISELKKAVPEGT